MYVYNTVYFFHVVIWVGHSIDQVAVKVQGFI